jgi:RNA polymerase sigma factor (sigma-70 family)
MNFQSAVGQGAGVDLRGSDADVIRASLSDPESFVAVFERHFDAIYGYLARRAGVDVGSELASEVFATAFTARSRYDLSRPDASPWLYGIAANLIRRRRRTEARRLRAYARSGVDRVGSDDELGSDPALAGALAALRSGDREVVLLFAWADLDYRQIAEALGIPLGTVRSRLNRARRQLRTALEGEPVARPEEAVNG